MKEIEEQLRYIVFNDLMSLPAYKLNSKYKDIFEEYVYTEFNKLIRKKNHKKLAETSNDKYFINKSISAIYQKPNRLKIFLFCLRSFHNRYSTITWIGIISYVLAFLIRASNSLLIITGLFCLLIFLFSFYIYFIEFSMWYLYVEITFSLINRTLDNIDNYIHNFGDINQENLPRRAELILKNIIKDEISSLNYDLWRLDILNIFFAFFISFVFVYILGNTFIEEIKWIANIFNFGNFEFIKNFNTETFTVIILFPIGIPLSKYIIVSGLKERNKRLRQSLIIFQTRIQERQKIKGLENN